MVISNYLGVLAAALVFLLASCTAQREGVTPLMIACKEGKLAETRKLIAEKAEVNRRSSYGWTALMFASRNGQKEVVLALLNAGADPNILSEKVPSPPFSTRGGHPQTTALREAIEAENLEVARLLIKRGARVDDTTVAYAGRVGDVEFLKELDRQEKSMKAGGENPYYSTGLFEAARGGELPALRWFVDNGENVNHILSDRTALSEAVRRDHPDAVRYLLSVGAKPDLRYGNLDETALFTAVSKHTEHPRFEANYQVVKILLDQGANPNSKSWKGTLSPLERVRKSLLDSTEHLSEIKDDVVRQRVKAHMDHKTRLIRLLQKY